VEDPPVVIFADREPWESFAQFAAALRRRGIRVERLTARDRPPVRRVNDLLQRSIFPRIRPVLRFTDGGRLLLGDLPAHLPPGIRAWEAVDAVAASVVGSGMLPPRTPEPAVEALLFDKLAMTRHAAGQGIPVPGSWAAEDDHPLRPPFLVKPRLGSGGEGVEVVTSEEDAARIRRRARAHAGVLMVQEWAPGELLHVGGVARGGSVVQAACYRAVGRPSAAFGPSTEVLTLDDPETLEQTATLMRSLGYTGAFCLDLVRDAAGTALLVDVNARIFGSWAVMQAAGMDVVGAYLWAHGLSAAPPSGAVPAGRRLRILPPDMSLRGPSLASAVRAHLIGIAQGARVLGPRWVVSVGVRLACALLVQAVRRPAGRLRGFRKDAR
jgi:hypothetical protein